MMDLSASSNSPSTLSESWMSPRLHPSLPVSAVASQPRIGGARGRARRSHASVDEPPVPPGSSGPSGWPHRARRRSRSRPASGRSSSKPHILGEGDGIDGLRPVTIPACHATHGLVCADNVPGGIRYGLERHRQIRGPHDGAGGLGEGLHLLQPAGLIASAWSCFVRSRRILRKPGEPLRRGMRRPLAQKREPSLRSATVRPRLAPWPRPSPSPAWEHPSLDPRA